MNTRFASLLLSSVLLLSTSASAQVLNEVLSIETSPLTVEVDNGTTEVLAEAAISAAVTPNFTVNYSALGDTLLSVTWSAPIGQQFLIAPPDGDWDLDGVSLGAAYGFNSELGSIQPVGTVASHDITASDGALPTFFPFNNLTGPGGDAFFAGVGLGGLQPGETYTFTSLTFESTIPASYDVDLDSEFLFYELEGDLFFTSDDPNPVIPPDPGQWISLVSIPEPSSLALMGLGGLLVAARLRNQ